MLLCELFISNLSFIYPLFFFDPDCFLISCMYVKRGTTTLEEFVGNVSLIIITAVLV